MRTSIILDDQLGQQLRDAARAEGKSLSAFLAEAGRAKLGQPDRSELPAFELVTFGKSGVRSGIDLDRTSELIAAEDEADYGG